MVRVRKDPDPPGDDPPRFQPLIPATAQPVSEELPEETEYEDEEVAPVQVHLQCPHCTSDDVKRSRRKFWERFVLPLLKAQVYRCRDCRHRWWVGVKWGPIILLGFSLVIVSAVAVGMVAARRAAQEAANAPRPVPIRRPRRIQPLPPLSGVPRPGSPPDPDPPLK